MGKFFLWVGVFAAIYLLIKLAGVVRRKGLLDDAQEAADKADSAHKANASRPATGDSAQAKNLTDLVSCAHCGLHLPRGEAIEHSGQTYCTKDHADRHE